MNHIRWKTTHSGQYARVKIGVMELYANVHWLDGKKCWLATAMFQNHGFMRVGELCNSMASCKEEAVKVAREMLEDNYVAVKAEMANFDMEES